jgi:hypothetical protein
VKSFTRLGAAVATAALAATAAALPAHAQAVVRTVGTSAPGLSAAQALVTARINGRLETLNALALAVNNAAHMTSSDKSTLSALIKSDISGLTALRTKVGGETTVAAVRADGTSMVDDYRVYMLVQPKVHLANAFDIEAAAQTALQKVHDDLAAKLSAAGGGTSSEQALLSDLESQIQAARQADSGHVSTLLAIQPGADADAIRNALSPLVSDARTARKDLVKARSDAEQLRAALGLGKGSKKQGQGQDQGQGQGQGS